MSVESRIQALSRARLRRNRQWSDQIEKAAEAVHRGTATMDQYRFLSRDFVTAWRDTVAQHTLAFVTLARLGNGDDFWPAALGYPPDVALPKSVQAGIMRLQADATQGKVKELPRPSLRQLRLRNALAAPAVRLDAPADRMEAACNLLALGDLHGMALRRRVWRIVGGEWVLSDVALAGGAKTFMSPGEADLQLDLGDRVTRGVESGAIAVGPVGVSHAELDRAVVALGWEGAHGPSSWSNEVKSGQPPDYEVCKDLQFGVHRIGCPATLPS